MSALPTRSSARTRTARRGANAVEFALTASLLIVVIIGLMESAWLFHHYFATVRASQRAVRIATAIEDPTAAQTAADAEARAALQGFGVDPDDATVTTSVTTAADGEIVSATIVLDNTQLVGLVPLPDSVTTTTSLRREDFSTE